MEVPRHHREKDVRYWKPKKMEEMRKRYDRYPWATWAQLSHMSEEQLEQVGRMRVAQTRHEMVAGVPIQPPTELTCKGEHPAFGVVPIIYRTLPTGKREVLVTTELKEDSTKQPGQLSLAGCETGRVMEDGVEEHYQATLMGGLGEEVFGRIGEEDEVVLRYRSPLFPYTFAPGVMARLVPVEVVKNGVPIGPRDGETQDTRWVGEAELMEQQNWRPGLQRIIPRIREYLDYMSFERGDSSFTVTVGKAFFDMLCETRSQYPDSKIRLRGNNG